MTTPLLTVVICTHNRAGLLIRTLDSLNGARRCAEGTQLLVVANHCSDDTHQVLQHYEASGANRLPMRWLAEPTKGKSHALNLALREVRTPLLAFVDDDQRVDICFLESIRDTARDNPDAALICGRLLPDWDGTEPEWLHDQGPYRIYPLPVPNFDLGAQPRWLSADIAVPSGGNAIVRTSWIARMGPFSTSLGPIGHDLGGSEDSEWFLRALQLGAKLLYAPTVVQYHVVEAERLATIFLMRLTYKRTASTVGLLGAPVVEAGVPLWAWRKLARYAVLALTAWSTNRRRFYLMRSAAAWGEIAGYRRLRRERTAKMAATGAAHDS